MVLARNFCLRLDILLKGVVFVNCLVDASVKPGERLTGIGMFANIIPITILQVVNERFCIESRIVTNLSFVVWKEWFTVRR